MSDIEARVSQLERKERARSLHDRQADLRASGYTGSHHDPETALIVSREPCEKCGQRTLRYLGGMVRLQPSWSLIAFIQCRSCGFWSEDV